MSDDIQTDFFDLIGTEVPDLSKLGFIDLIEWCIIHDIKNSSKESRAIWDSWHENNAALSITIFPDQENYYTPNKPGIKPFIIP